MAAHLGAHLAGGAAMLIQVDRVVGHIRPRFPPDAESARA
jgi:hypothetical protein